MSPRLIRNRTQAVSCFPSCFRAASHPSPENFSGGESCTTVNSAARSPSLATSVYHTNVGLFAVTWSTRTLLGRSVDFHIQFYHHRRNHHSCSAHVQIKSLLFWTKRGCTTIDLKHPAARSAQLCWDLTGAKFALGPEPESGYYVAVVVQRQIILLIGDRWSEACMRTGGNEIPRPQALLLRREHVTGNRTFSTSAKFGSMNRLITIDFTTGDDPCLRFSIGDEVVLQIKQLNWKFRGNGKAETDGVPFQISWDVYNWMFDEVDGHAVFMFRFDRFGDGSDESGEGGYFNEKGELLVWPSWGYGMNGIEKKKIHKGGLLGTTRTSSLSSSFSSSTSGSSSSVIEWASKEEELEGPSGFSLIIYAWRR